MPREYLYHYNTRACQCETDDTGAVCAAHGTCLFGYCSCFGTYHGSNCVNNRSACSPHAPYSSRYVAGATAQNVSTPIPVTVWQEALPWLSVEATGDHSDGALLLFRAYLVCRTGFAATVRVSASLAGLPNHSALNADAPVIKPATVKARAPQMAYACATPRTSVATASSLPVPPRQRCFLEWWASSTRRTPLQPHFSQGPSPTSVITRKALVPCRLALARLVGT